MAQTKTKPTRRTKDAPSKTTKDIKPSKELVDDIDAILDEIDTVLEEACCATEYRQKGGQ